MSDEGNSPQLMPTRVMRAGDRRSLSRSATRALDVLEFFGQVRRPLRAIEIARRFELHPSTVNQLLKTMLESAHLTFDAATKTYLPSPRLTCFSGWMIETYGADERLRRLIAELHAASGEVVTLTTPNDLFMQVIDMVGADAAPDSVPERGLRVSLFGSAIGAAYLSTQSDAEVRRLSDRARISVAEHEALNRRLAGVRVDGFAEGPSAGGGIWSIAAPLPAGSFNVPLVLGLAGPATRVQSNLRALSSALRTGILRISRR